MLAICSIGMYAQDEYDPKNPPDPQAPVKLYPLYCQISPAGAGYTDMGDGKKFEKGSAVTVNAESNSHYKFVCWMQDNLQECQTCLYHAREGSTPCGSL